MAPDMKLPEEGKEVLVKLANGSFAVARWVDLGCYNDWVVGDGVKGCEIDLFSSVVSWSELPE
jgi:hypothetical protein